jgi:putative PIN family toxin of toxin-antitoxin system
MGVKTAGSDEPLRVVLDTNVLVSALLYRDGELAWLAPAWQAGAVLPLASLDIVEELTRIIDQLGQLKFGLEQPAIAEIIARYLSFTELVAASSNGHSSMPKCRDPDDQKFLDLAERAHADVLVTSDRALLGLARKTPFLILSPVKFRERVQDTRHV